MKLLEFFKRLNEVTFMNQYPFSHADKSEDLPKVWRTNFDRLGKKINQIGDLEIYSRREKRRTFMFMVKDKQVIGFMQLDRTELTKDVRDVHNVMVVQKMTGQGYGYLFYEIAILQKKYVLLSRNLLTSNSQSIWSRMVQDPRITVYGIHHKYTSNEYYAKPKEKVVPIFAESNSITTEPGIDMDDVVLIARATNNLPRGIKDWLLHDKKSDRK